MRQPTHALITACLTATLVGLAANGPLGRMLEREIGQYLIVRTRGIEAAPLGVVIVAQDYASAAVLELPAKLSSWPRRHLAAVIERATAAGARAIAIDLLLERPQTEADDTALEQAIAASGRVVLAERMRRSDVSTAPGQLRIIKEWTEPLLPRFVRNAVAAPWPLPEGLWRTAAFWTFKKGAEGRATLPAAALLTAVFADPAPRTALARAALKEKTPRLAESLARTDPALEFRVGRTRVLLGDDSAAAKRLVRRVRAESLDSPTVLLMAAAVRLLAGPDVHLLIPYGAAGQVPRVSYHRVLAGDPEALAMLRGSIVFVGASDLGNQAEGDTYRTVFAGQNGIRLSGVEIAATACLNLLHDDAAIPVSLGVAALLPAGVAAATTLAAVALPTLVPAVMFAVTLGGGLTALSVVVLEVWQTALPLASMLFVALPLGLATGRLCCHDATRRQLDRAVTVLTRGRLRRMSPNAGLDHAVRREQRWVVCLASDIAGYVHLTESMTAREGLLVEFLTAYRGIVHEVVERHGGTVLDFVGDASMCLWDGDAPSPTLRARAILAALELAQRLDAFAETRGFHEHRTRIGLAGGTIVLGNMDAAGCFTFGAIGAPLNMASRLEQLNKQYGTQVLATAALVQDLQGLPARLIGAVPIKGKAEPESVFALEPARSDGRLPACSVNGNMVHSGRS